METHELAVATRIVAAEAQVPLRVMASGRLRQEQEARLAATRARLRQTPLFIQRMREGDVETLADDARKAWQLGRLDLLIVDYVQLLQIFGGGYPHEEQFCVIIRRLKHLARELEVPVIAVSQLSPSRVRVGQTPALDDLEGATPLVEHADEVLLIHWPEGSREPRDTILATPEIIVAKNRNGPLESLRLGFVPELATFTNLEDVAAA